LVGSPWCGGERRRARKVAVLGHQKGGRKERGGGPGAPVGSLGCHEKMGSIGLLGRENCFSI
jgi:hypothetical protein